MQNKLEEKVNKIITIAQQKVDDEIEEQYSNVTDYNSHSDKIKKNKTDEDRIDIVISLFKRALAHFNEAKHEIACHWNYAINDNKLYVELGYEELLKESKADLQECIRIQKELEYKQGEYNKIQAKINNIMEKIEMINKHNRTRNKKNQKGKKMRTFKVNFKDIIFIIIFILIDTYCLFWYAESMPIHRIWAIIFALLIATVLDTFSWYASFSGAGQWLHIPDVPLDEIKIDKRKARIITVLMVLFLIGGQVTLIVFRGDQIIKKTREHESRKVEYNNTLNENKFSSQREAEIFKESSRPEYDGSQIMDILSIIVPILTTVLSFIIGMRSVKGYDRFEKEVEEKQIELKRKQDELLEKQMELDKFNNQADSKITDIQIAGEITNLREIILLDISGKNKNALGSFIMRLESNLRNGVPKIYEKQNERLIAILLGQAEKIKIKLSHNANDPTVIMGINLENDFENEINQLKTPEGMLNKKSMGVKK